MAVFPYARRALSRPARMPWLIAALALFVVTLTLPVATLLVASRDAGSQRPVAGSQASAELGPSALTTTLPLTDEAVQSSALRPANETIDEASMSEGVLAAEAEAYLATLLAGAAPATGTIAEVSEAPVRAVAEPATEPAETTSTDTSTVEAAQAQPAAEVAPSAPVVAPPALPAPIAPAGPVERWAAAGIVIVTEGQSLDDASLANVDAALSVLPSSVLNSLGNSAFGALHILVNTEGRVLSGDQPYRGPANFFSTNEATNELVLYPQQSVFTIVHELGHAYNLRRTGAGRYAMVLLDAEMRSFLTATGWQITSTDAEIRTAVDHMHVAYSYVGSFHWPRLSNDDPLEDFANSFAMYFLDPASLQQMSPDRYTWMAATFGR